MPKACQFLDDFCHNLRVRRAVLNALLERGRRWEELDASLEKETREAARKSHYKTASRAALRRARMAADRRAAWCWRSAAWRSASRAARAAS
jgi:hypothetical protein